MDPTADLLSCPLMSPKSQHTIENSGPRHLTDPTLNRRQPLGRLCLIEIANPSNIPY